MSLLFRLFELDGMDNVHIDLGEKFLSEPLSVGFPSLSICSAPWFIELEVFAADLIVLTLSFPSWSLNSYWLGSPKSKLTHRPAGCAAFSKILFSLRLKQLQWRGSALMF